MLTYAQYIGLGLGAGTVFLLLACCLLGCALNQCTPDAPARPYDD